MTTHSENVIRKVQIHSYECDACHSVFSNRLTCCCGCGKDICKKCQIIIFENVFDLDSCYDDCQRRYCKNCYSLIPYDELKNLKLKCDLLYDQLEKLEEKWKTDCKNNTLCS